MILNNATKNVASWEVSNPEDRVYGTKSPESWGKVTPPSGPFIYTVRFDQLSVDNVNNPDACITYTGTELLVTYPGA